MLSEGIPDLCIFINKKTIWIELKYKKLPVRATTNVKVGIRPAQRIWHRKASRQGISCFVLTKLENGDILLHSSYEHIDDLYNGMITEDLYKSSIVNTKSNKDIILKLKDETNVI